MDGVRTNGCTVTTYGWRDIYGRTKECLLAFGLIHICAFEYLGYRSFRTTSSLNHFYNTCACMHCFYYLLNVRIVCMFSYLLNGKRKAALYNPMLRLNVYTLPCHCIAKRIEFPKRNTCVRPIRFWARLIRTGNMQTYSCMDMMLNMRPDNVRYVLLKTAVEGFGMSNASPHDGKQVRWRRE